MTALLWLYSGSK